MTFNVYIYEGTTSGEELSHELAKSFQRKPLRYALGVQGGGRSLRYRHPGGTGDERQKI